MVFPPTKKPFYTYSLKTPSLSSGFLEVHVDYITKGYENGMNWANYSITNGLTFPNTNIYSVPDSTSLFYCGIVNGIESSQFETIFDINSLKTTAETSSTSFSSNILNVVSGQPFICTIEAKNQNIDISTISSFISLSFYNPLLFKIPSSVSHSDSTGSSISLDFNNILENDDTSSFITYTILQSPNELFSSFSIQVTIERGFSNVIMYESTAKKFIQIKVY